MDHQISESAVASKKLNAGLAVGRRDVASRGRAARAVAGQSGGVDIEGPHGVVNDVLRQNEDEPARVIEAQLDRSLQLLPRHAHEAAVAADDSNAALRS